MMLDLLFVIRLKIEKPGLFLESLTAELDEQ